MEEEEASVSPTVKPEQKGVPCAVINGGMKRKETSTTPDVDLHWPKSVGLHWPMSASMRKSFMTNDGLRTKMRPRRVELTRMRWSSGVRWIMASATRKRKRRELTVSAMKGVMKERARALRLGTSH